MADTKLHKCPRCGVYEGTMRGVKLHLQKGPICEPIYTLLSREEVIKDLDTHMKEFADINIPKLRADCKQQQETIAKLTDHVQILKDSIAYSDEKIEMLEKLLSEYKEMYDAQTHSVNIAGEYNKVTIVFKVVPRIIAYTKLSALPDFSTEYYKKIIEDSVKVVAIDNSTIFIVEDATVTHRTVEIQSMDSPMRRLALTKAAMLAS